MLLDLRAFLGQLWALQANGAGASAGNANLQLASGLSADGAGSSAGGLAVRVTWTLVGAGAGSSSGALDVTVPTVHVVVLAGTASSAGVLALGLVTPIIRYYADSLEPLPSVSEQEPAVAVESLEPVGGYSTRRHGL